MSITAIFVFTATAFTTDRTSTIEQLAPNAPGSSTTQVNAGIVFTLKPGVYRLNSGASITPVTARGSVAATNGATSPTGHVITPLSDTKTKWPDPTVHAMTAASAALNISLAQVESFLTDAGEETELD